MTSSPTLTISYKKEGDQDMLVDIFVPKTVRNQAKPLPIFVYYHGGGMTAGDRTSWFPTWMLTRAHAAEYIFMSPEYHLMAPSTGHDILVDIKDLFSFIDTKLDQSLAKHGFTADSSRIIVAGSSAGGLCAYLAGAHAQPRPRCVLSMYGMGGDFLTTQYLALKHKPFFLNREMLSPTAPEFAPLVYPFSPEVRNTPTISSALTYHPVTGIPTNPRMPLARLYLQMGQWLDYWTGQYEPSLSAALREALGLVDMDAKAGEVSLDSAREGVKHVRELVPIEHQPVFPQAYFSDPDSKFPSTFLIHGRADTAVYVRESENAKVLLQSAGVDAVLRIVDGKEHSFDYEAGSDSEEKLKWLFDEVFEFIEYRLRA